VTRTLTVAAYVILGAALVWSRVVGLTRGYCCDEIRTVEDYVQRGPRAILAGPYIPNNHELFSLLGWLTQEAGARSEVALRLWAVLPFILGVVVVTTWLHRRIGALSGILFLFLATASPLLLDISRMARGYGLAFLAMSVLVVAALEAESTASGWAIVAVTTSGLVGSLTFPHFAIAYVIILGVLLGRRELRTRVAIGSAIALLAVAAWYAPHVDDIARSTLGEYGLQIETKWLLTAPIDQTLVPALTVLDDSFVRPTLPSLIFAVLLGAIVASSPLLRQGSRALIVTLPVVATVVAFWITGTYVVPRFLSFLLVPLFMLLATGAAAVIAAIRTRPAPIRTVATVATFGVLALQFGELVVDVTRFPRDSTQDAARTIGALASPSTPVLAHVPYPRDLSYYLGRPVQHVATRREAQLVCGFDRRVVYVDQPFLVPDAPLPCLERAGVRHRQLRQYARGGRISVWLIPPGP
jgi:hypothetical protein